MMTIHPHHPARLLLLAACTLLLPLPAAHAQTTPPPPQQKPTQPPPDDAGPQTDNGSIVLKKKKEADEPTPPPAAPAASMPLMIACLAYLGPNPLWSGVDVQTRLHAVAAQVVLVQSWIPVRAIYFGANGPAWSISVEAFFYALFPLLAFVLFANVRSELAANGWLSM